MNRALAGLDRGRQLAMAKSRPDLAQTLDGARGKLDRRTIGVAIVGEFKRGKSTLVNALLHHAPELATLPRAGLVHRLDKDTTGLLVVARSLRAHAALVEQLRARRIEREYLAVVNGVPVAGGTVDAPVGRHPVMPRPHRLPRPEHLGQITPGDPRSIPVHDPLHHQPGIRERPTLAPGRTRQHLLDQRPLSI